jgi:flagellar basal-body rod protein FlgG
MFRSLFIAATGMNAQKLNIDVVANNLANTNTTGFKKSRADFQDLMYQSQPDPGTISGEGIVYPTGMQVGLGVKPIAVQKMFLQGDFKNTGNELDLVIQGRGFFQISMPDGTIAYTRNGEFKIDANGRIVNSEGHPLEPAITIPTDTLSLTVSPDGIVTAMQAGQTAPTQLGQIELANFVNPAGLKALGGNLFQPSDASGTEVVGVPGAEGRGSLSQGFLEMSNVNVVEEMVNMIVGQRAYEVNSKAVQTSDEMMQVANNLKR